MLLRGYMRTKTALVYAVEGGYTEIAEILRKHGAEEELPQTEAVRE